MDVNFCAAPLTRDYGGWIQRIAAFSLFVWHASDIQNLTFSNECFFFCCRWTEKWKLWWENPENRWSTRRTSITLTSYSVDLGATANSAGRSWAALVITSSTILTCLLWCVVIRTTMDTITEWRHFLPREISFRFGCWLIILVVQIIYWLCILFFTWHAFLYIILFKLESISDQE